MGWFWEHVAIDGSLTGIWGRFAACGCAVVQLDYDNADEAWYAIYGIMLAALEVQRTFKRTEFWYFTLTLSCLIVPSTIHTDNTSGHPWEERGWANSDLADGHGWETLFIKETSLGMNSCDQKWRRRAWVPRWILRCGRRDNVRCSLQCSKRSVTLNIQEVKNRKCRHGFLWIKPTNSSSLLGNL